MTEEITEPLQIEEPKVAKETKPDVDGLIKELEKFGVESPQDLSGKLEAGTQAGRLAQLLGDERKRTAEYEARIRELQATPPPPKQDYMDYGEGQTIDIEAAIERSVSKVIDKKAEQQRKLQEVNLQRWNQINSDPNYGLVKDVWEQKLKDPNFTFKVQNGIVDPVAEYNTTVVDYMKTLLKQSHDTIKKIRGGPRDAPHIETDGRSSANMVSTTPSGSPFEQKIKATKEAVEKGKVLTSEEEVDLMDAIFGTTNPL